MTLVELGRGGTTEVYKQGERATSISNKKYQPHSLATTKATYTYTATIPISFADQMWLKLETKRYDRHV